MFSLVAVVAAELAVLDQQPAVALWPRPVSHPTYRPVTKPEYLNSRLDKARTV